MLDSLENLVAQLTGLVAVVEVLNPLLVQSFHIIGNGSILDGLLDEAQNAGAHLLVGDGHTQTELAEVLEQ